MPRVLLTREEKLARKRESNRRWAEANPGKVKASREKYDSANKDKIAAYKAAARQADPDKFNRRAEAWRQANPEKAKSYSAKRYQENKEAFTADMKAWRAANPEKAAAATKRWKASNGSRIRERANQRWSEDQQFRVAGLLRNRLRKAIGRGQKSGSILDLLGCDVPALMLHLERQFTKGMSWENAGEWHIDHIVPLSSFDLLDAAQVARACHFTNLRPLWASENQSKGAKALHLI